MKGVEPYPAYRAVPDLMVGTVPSHWQVRRLGSFLNPVKQRNRPDLPLLSVARERGVFVRNLTGDDGNHNVIPDDLSNYKVAPVGSLVINKMKAWQGSMGIAPIDGIVSPAYFVYRVNVLDPYFAARLLRSKPYVAEFGRASDGVRVGQWDLSIDRMKAISVVVPPPAEQRAIVRFLNYAVRRVDRAISDHQKSTALLQERRQRVTMEAILGASNKNRLKEVDGFSDPVRVPHHWTVMRAKDVWRESDTRSTTGDEELLSVSHLTGVTRRSSKNITMFKSASYVGSKLCEPNDLVINTMWAWMGALGVAREAGVVSPSYGVYRPKHCASLHPDYVENLLRTPQFIAEYNLRSRGITSSRLRLYPESFLRMKVPIPDYEEQAEIVATLKLRTASLDKVLGAKAREIRLLQEYKANLIVAAVTGDIDVRGCALEADGGESIDQIPTLQVEADTEDEAA